MISKSKKRQMKTADKKRLASQRKHSTNQVANMKRRAKRLRQTANRRGTRKSDAPALLSEAASLDAKAAGTWKKCMADQAKGPKRIRRIRRREEAKAKAA